MRGGSAPARFAGGGFLLFWWGREGEGGARGGTCTTNEFCLSMGSSAGSQGEGGPGEMELSVASDGGV